MAEITINQEYVVKISATIETDLTDEEIENLIPTIPEVFKEMIIEEITGGVGTVEVEPVKHAAFVRDEEHWYICGNCHHATCSEFDLEGEYKKIEINGKVETIYALKQPNYCKHCGSKMDGKEVQEDE